MPPSHFICHMYLFSMSQNIVNFLNLNATYQVSNLFLNLPSISFNFFSWVPFHTIDLYIGMFYSLDNLSVVCLWTLIGHGGLKLGIKSWAPQVKEVKSAGTQQTITSTISTWHDRLEHPTMRRHADFTSDLLRTFFSINRAFHQLVGNSNFIYLHYTNLNRVSRDCIKL